MGLSILVVSTHILLQYFKYHSLPLFRYKNYYHSALCISSSLFTQAWNEAGLRYPRAREPCENGYYFFMV